MSFAVAYPFDESAYPSDLRRLWRELPGPAKATLVESGRRFGSLGSHAMVLGTVPVLFGPEAEPLIGPHIDGRYLQRIPEVYREVPGKLWVDADVLNYAAALSARPSHWLATALPGTGFLCLSNTGTGPARDVRLALPEAASVDVAGRPCLVEPREGLLLSFLPGLPRPCEVEVEWAREDGTAHSEVVQLPTTGPCPPHRTSQRLPATAAGPQAAGNPGDEPAAQVPFSLATA